ncbi:MAG: phosphoethanolamine transferase domain-containing protein, partial [Muribaculaceae bacterium]|nr:phosphoethanolamine transferase domain-containing protein [Muribaculaceae bacterium]
MKHSKFRKKQSDKKQNNVAPDQRILPVILMWSVPLILSIPAVALSIMGHYSWAASLTQVLLPMGVMLVLLSVWRRVGITTLCLLPFMTLAAFQIVLLFLYADGSIIGVDMFLNVVTTNSSEALELLGNLLPAIALCIALYLPVLIIAIMITRRGWGVNSPRRRMAAFVGCLIAAVGTLALATSLSSERSYKIDEDLYPVNVCNNMAEAFKRSYRTKNYYRDSADFSFGVSSERPDSIREVYIAVIGETSRADNWQLFGYYRFTTPYLCSMPDSALAAYAHTLSESNTTHKAVPLLLSTLTSDNFGKQINRTKSVVSAFKEAGYATDFISMQARNRSYI